MADRTLTQSAVEAAPDDYLIPSGPDLALKTVTAHLDGSGAAGAWFPALQVLDPAGTPVWTAVAPTAVAAGASVDASWFRGVAGETTTLSVPGLMWASVEISGAFAITDSTNGNIVTWHDAIDDTGSPTPFFNSLHPTRMTAPISGYYLSLGNLEFDAIPVDTNLGCYLYKNGATGLNFSYEFNTRTILSADGAGSASYNLQGGTHGVFFLNAGDYLELLAYVQPSTGVTFPVHLIDLRPTQNHFSKWSLICLAAA